MKHFILSLCLLSSVSSMAASNDVTPHKTLHKGDHYVKVIRFKGYRVAFEKCVAGLEKSTCVRLGNKRSYTLNELRSQRSIENAQIAGAIGADIGIGIAAFYGGAYLLAITGFGDLAGVGGLLLGSSTAATPAAIGSVIVASVDPVNPVEQTRQAKTLNETVITDKDVIQTDIDDFIDRLDLVLSKL